MCLLAWMNFLQSQTLIRSDAKFQRDRRKGEGINVGVTWLSWENNQDKKVTKPSEMGVTQSQDRAAPFLQVADASGRVESFYTGAGSAKLTHFSSGQKQFSRNFKVRGRVCKNTWIHHWLEKKMLWQIIFLRDRFSICVTPPHLWQQRILSDWKL